MTKLKFSEVVICLRSICQVAEPGFKSSYLALKYMLFALILHSQLLTCGTKGKSFVLFMPQFPHIYCERLDCVTTSSLQFHHVKILCFSSCLVCKFSLWHPLLLTTLLLWVPEHKIYTITSIFKSLSSYQLPFIKVLLICQDTAIIRRAWWLLSNSIHCLQYSFNL